MVKVPVEASDTRAEQKRATRRLLMRSAQTCVAAHGYANTSVERIVAEAGLSRATFYLHFPSKAAVAHAVIADVRERSVALLGADSDRPVTHDELCTAVRSWIRLYRDETGAFLLWHEASAAEPGIDPAIDVHRSDLLRRIVGDATWRSPESSARAEVLAAMMFLGLDRLCYAWFVSGWQMDEALVVDEVVESWETYFIPRIRGTVADDSR